MIEAELKARVLNPKHVMGKLEGIAEGRFETYQDTYYDDPSGSLGARDEKLRVRTIHGPNPTRSLVSYKGSRVDSESGSKPEYETRVDDPEAVHAMLQALGYVQAIAFQKRCRNYEFRSRGRSMLATLVQVPEMDGTFLEIETIVPDEKELSPALDDVRSVMGTLGIHEDDFTTELYTDTVAARRSAG